MGITIASLSTKIQTEVVAQMGSPANDSVQLKRMADAIAKAVVDEIHTNATITGTGSVTSGPGAGGAVSITTGAVL